MTITDKGLKLLDKLDDKQDKMDDILSNLSEKEASNLNKLLDKIRTTDYTDVNHGFRRMSSVKNPRHR